MTQITLSDLPETIQTLPKPKKQANPSLSDKMVLRSPSFPPIKKKSLLEIFSTLEPLNEDFADVDEGLLPLDDIEMKNDRSR